MQMKCPVILTCPLSVVIVADELIWGHARQTVLLQGKVPVGCFGRFRGRLLLTNRSFRFLARLKAFSDGFLRMSIFIPPTVSGVYMENDSYSAERSDREQKQKQQQQLLEG